MLVVSYKDKYILTSGPEISFLNIYSWETKVYVLKKTCMEIFLATLLITAQN